LGIEGILASRIAWGPAIDGPQAGNTIIGIGAHNRQNILVVAIGVAAMVSVALSISADARFRFISPQADAKIDSYASLDRQLDIDGRGVYLRFMGFDFDTIGYAAKFYYRAIYDLYPRTVLLADPSVVISNADDIVISGAPPDRNWLAGHGIDRILTVYFEPGIFQFSVEVSKVN
jgi:hypothetical protein